MKTERLQAFGGLNRSFSANSAFQEGSEHYLTWAAQGVIFAVL